jgi:hypothetical protein
MIFRRGVNSRTCRVERRCYSIENDQSAVRGVTVRGVRLTYRSAGLRQPDPEVSGRYHAATGRSSADWQHATSRRTKQRRGLSNRCQHAACVRHLQQLQDVVPGSASQATLQQQLVIAGYTSGNVQNVGEASIAQRDLDARRIKSEVDQYGRPLPTMRAFIHGYDDLAQLQAQELDGIRGSPLYALGDGLSRAGGHDIDSRMLAGQTMQGTGGVLAIGTMAYGARGPNIPSGPANGVLTSQAAVNPKIVLQNVVNRAVADLNANPALARDLMSSGSYRQLINQTKLADASYGKAVERLTARYVREDQDLSSILKYQSRPFVSTPDFFGYDGQNLHLLDITTEPSIPSHMLRPYGPATDYVIHPGLPEGLEFPQ